MVIIISLILLGILMMLVEFLLTPGVGVAGVLGLCAFGGSCYYAWTEIGQDCGLTVLAIIVVIMILEVVWILRAKTWKKLELGTVIDAKVNQEGDHLQTGVTGKTVTRLAPMGSARFGKTTCEVNSEGNIMLDPDTNVVISRIDGHRIFVKPINN